MIAVALILAGFAAILAALFALSALIAWYAGLPSNGAETAPGKAMLVAVKTSQPITDMEEKAILYRLNGLSQAHLEEPI